MSWTAVLWFILVFCIIVISHEFGHFIVAKLNGIHVVEFTVGVGPKIFGFHKNGTYYVLRWLPFGGACIFDGMTDEDILEDVKGNGKGDDNSNSEQDAEAVDSVDNAADVIEEESNKNYGIKFKEAPVWARISVVLAGPIANFIIAFLMAIIIVWFCGSDEPIIHELKENYPAAESGLRYGDRIVKINGSSIKTAREIYVLTFVNKSGKPMEITYERDGQIFSTVIVPQYDAEEDRYLLGLLNYGEYVACNNSSVFKYALYEVRYGLVATIRSIGMLVTGNGSKDDLAGPVGMAEIIGNVEKQAKPYGPLVLVLNMINIAMLLSVNLGVMNLLPIPAIDGGRLLFYLIEAVRGKPVSANKEGIVTLVGFILLVILMIFVLFNDIMRLVG